MRRVLVLVSLLVSTNSTVAKRKGLGANHPYLQQLVAELRRMQTNVAESKAYQRSPMQAAAIRHMSDHGAQLRCAHLGFDFPGVWMHFDIASPVELGERATGYGVALLMNLFGDSSNNQLLKSIAPKVER